MNIWFSTSWNDPANAGMAEAGEAEFPASKSSRSTSAVLQLECALHHLKALPKPQTSEPLLQNLLERWGSKICNSIKFSGVVDAALCGHSETSSVLKVRDARCFLPNIENYMLLFSNKKHDG